MSRSSLTKPSAVNLIDTWSTHVVEELNPASQRRYRTCLLAFVEWFEQVQQRPLSLDDLKVATLVGYRANLQLTAATSTVNVHLCALRNWCGYLVQHNYLNINPATRLKLIRQTRSLAPKALEPVQLNTLLRQTAHTRYPVRNTAIIHLLVQTGLRIGECASLHLEDLQFGERQGHLLVRLGKGHKARSVPLNASSRQALADYLAPRLGVAPTLKAVAAAWPSATMGNKPSGLWFSERGSLLSLREMNHIVQLLLTECVRQELLPTGLTPHSLRHTFAKIYLARHPADLVGLARLLGHSSLETTRIYLEPTATELAARVEALEINIYAH